MIAPTSLWPWRAELCSDPEPAFSRPHTAGDPGLLAPGAFEKLLPEGNSV